MTIFIVMNTIKRRNNFGFLDNLKTPYWQENFIKVAVNLGTVLLSDNLKSDYIVTSNLMEENPKGQ